MSAEWCSGFTLASCAEGAGFLSPPDASRPVTMLQIGTASAGDTHSLTSRTNPPTS